MATSADIETALVAAVASAIYPVAGTAFPGKVTIARGWPTEADIKNAISAGANLVGIYAVEAMARDVTRSQRYWQSLSAGVGAMEVGRVEQVFRLDIWAASPALRDALLALLEPALKYQLRYNMPDGSLATLMLMQPGGPNDRPSRADEWAQSLALTFQYSLIATQAQPVVTTINVTETLNTVLVTDTQTSKES